MVRVRLSENEGPFVSHPVRLARVSFALLDGDQPDLRGTGPYATAVIAWPVDGAGYLDEARVRGLEARVVRWDLSTAELAALRELHLDGWRFTTSDLLVTGGPATPCFIPTARTMRGSIYAPRLDLEQLERIAFSSV